MRRRPSKAEADSSNGRERLQVQGTTLHRNGTIEKALLGQMGRLEYDAPQRSFLDSVVSDAEADDDDADAFPLLLHHLLELLLLMLHRHRQMTRPSEPVRLETAATGSRSSLESIQMPGTMPLLEK